MNWHKIFKFLGIFLGIIVLISAVLDYLEFENLYFLLWFCNFSALLLGISFYFSWNSLVATIFFSALVYQIPWMTNYVQDVLLFPEDPEKLKINFLFWISFISHVLLLPLAAFWVYKYKYSIKNVIKISLFLFIFFVVFIYFFTDPLENINCLNYPCSYFYKIDASSLIIEELGNNKQFWKRSIVYLLSFSFVIAISKYFKISDS